MEPIKPQRKGYETPERWPSHSDPYASAHNIAQVAPVFQCFVMPVPAEPACTERSHPVPAKPVCKKRPGWHSLRHATFVPSAEDKDSVPNPEKTDRNKMKKAKTERKAREQNKPTRDESRAAKRLLQCSRQ